MKISYRNQAVLKMLQTGFMGPIAVNSQDKEVLTDELIEQFGKLWKLSVKSFNKNIRILSDPFAHAVMQSGDKLVTGDLLDKAFLENTSGTLIINDRTLCYKFERINETVTELTYYFFKRTPADAPELRCFMFMEFDGKDSSASSQTYFAKSGLYNGDLTVSIEMYTKMLISTLNFIRYAEIEVKVLPPNKIVKDIRCKYVNDTNAEIQILDSTWFTTLIQTDKFKVRGHFRLQPKKKEGEWTKEIIWINEFEKTGYKAPAKKLNEQPNL